MSSWTSQNLPAVTRAGLAGILILLGLAAANSAHAHRVHQHAAEVEPEKSVRERLQEFRQTGDDESLHAAWAQLEPRLDEDAGADLLLDGALVAQALHRFERAQMLTEQVLRRQPRNDQAWLLASSIDLVLGDHARAAFACDQLSQTSPLVAVTCHARTATGRQNQTRVGLERLLASGITNNAPPEVLAWSFSVAGDLAAEAQQDYTAINHYHRSLELSESTQVRSALVDALLRVGWNVEADTVLRSGSVALPLEVRRLIVARRLGNAKVQDAGLMHETFQAWMRDGDWLHAREMARFYLDVQGDRDLAAHIAGINYGIQRETEDRRLLERTSTPN